MSAKLVHCTSLAVRADCTGSHRRRARRLRSIRVAEELAVAAHLAQAFEQQFEVLVAVDRVELSGIHDEKRCGVVLVEIARVALGHLLEVESSVMRRSASRPRLRMRSIRVSGRACR